MPAILITGANRGIGLALVVEYATAGWEVHATARNPDTADALGKAEGNVTLHALEVTDFASVKALADKISTPLDIVIANAGVSGKPVDGSEAGRLGALDFDTWRETMEVNLLAAVATCEAFTPHVEKAGGKLIAISSQLASNTNAFFGGYAYNSSKAALNMAMNLMAIELQPKGVAVGTLHPGWVQTDMGGTQAPVTPAQSAAGLRQVIDSLTPAERAHYVAYDGERLPW
jgi:NAD(P)-dependent dehydrogenase (short-subunit alcohol dehydrogenase family)